MHFGMNGSETDSSQTLSTLPSYPAYLHRADTHCSSISLSDQQVIWVGDFGVWKVEWKSSMEAVFVERLGRL